MQNKNHHLVIDLREERFNEFENRCLR